MVIYLKVKPGQRFDRVEKSGDSPHETGAKWQIRLKAPAIDGKANEYLVEYLSEVLEISKSKISLKKGKTSRIKCLEIDADEKSVHEKLESSINKSM